MKDERRPQAASASTSLAGDGITVEQAARELQRRRLPRERRHEGRDAAMVNGSFWLSKAELREIAEGGS